MRLRGRLAIRIVAVTRQDRQTRGVSLLVTPNDREQVIRQRSVSARIGCASSEPWKYLWYHNHKHSTSALHVTFAIEDGKMNFLFLILCQIGSIQPLPRRRTPPDRAAAAAAKIHSGSRED